MFRLYIMSRESREEAKYLDSFEIDMDGFTRVSESPNNQASSIKEGQQIESANTSRKRKSSSSQTLDEIFDDEDFKEFIKNNIKPIDSPRQSNVDNDNIFFQIHQSSETPNREHSNEKENEYIEYLKYAFCVSSLKCGNKKYIDDAHKFSGRDYTEILDNVIMIKDKYSKNLDILNKELLFIKEYTSINKPPIGIIIYELQKTINRFDGKKQKTINRFDGKKKKGGKKSYKKKSTKKSRTKKARK